MTPLSDGAAPTLDDGAIAAMVRGAGAQAGLVFSDRAVDTVTRVARGVPAQARLIGLRITQATVRRGDDLVMDQDILEAVETLVRDADPAVASAYGSVTAAGTDGAACAALARLANAAQDVWGAMRIEGEGNARSIGGEAVPPAFLSLLLQAGILVKAPGMADRSVRFADSAMLVHIQCLDAQRILRAEQAPPASPGRRVA